MINNIKKIHCKKLTLEKFFVQKTKILIVVNFNDKETNSYSVRDCVRDCVRDFTKTVNLTCD